MIEINLFLAGVIVTIITGIIGYFLKGTMEDIKELKKQVNSNKTELDVLTNDHTNKYDHLIEKIDSYIVFVQDLTKEMKDVGKKLNELTVEISKKKS